MSTKYIKVGDFRFTISEDMTVDPLSAVEVFVYFRNEPCCDDSGHQYRFYLPIGIREETLLDLCQAFTRAVHCEQFASAA